VSFGGAYQAAQSKAYMKPYASQRGIRVAESDYNGDYGLLQQRASAPVGAWDVVSVESAPTERAGREGLLRELPASVFKGLHLTPGAQRPYAAGHLVFSTVLAYNTNAWPGKQPPASWSDFWDVQKFPGKRALRNNPRGTLEIALLASGVDPKHLYPLDIDKAFSFLDRLRPHLVFWSSGAQPVQLLANGEVAMSSAYNGRIWDAREKQKLPLGWSWRNGLMETEYWAIPKNAKNPEEAEKFIAFSLQARQQANFANEIAYGPTNLDALPFVTAEITRAVPNSPEALPTQIPVDADWWAQNEAAVNARWEQWQNRR
jgi:putative spermidine/putrescine transport system substrate-binding protein